jgi:hypothetical protein
MKQNAARRRFTWRFIPLMLGYIVAVFASGWAIDTFHTTSPLLVVLAILPAVPLIGTIAVMGIYLTEETDEFLRHRSIVAMLWGLGVLLATATIWGFLQLGGVVGSAPIFLAYPFWFVIFGIAQGGLSLVDRLAVRA